MNNMNKINTNAKKQVKPFNVDYMRKKSIYVITKREELVF